MTEVLKTVLIKGKNGDPVRINERDYDEEKHGALYKGKEANEQNEQPVDTAEKAPEAPADAQQRVAPSMPDGVRDPQAPATPSPNQMLVTKKGKKFFVVDTNGAVIEHQGIDADGYGSEGDAWAAVMAANNGSAAS